MGLCHSQGAYAPDDVDKGIAEEKQADVDEEEPEVVRVLLLGAGGSGKSTLFKQFKNLYGKGLPEDEREYLTEGVYINVIQGMKVLIQESETHGPVAAALEEAKQAMIDISVEGPVNHKVGGYIKELWADPGIQATFQKRSQFQFYDSGEYFFGRIDAIMQDDYIPSDADCLRCRVSTTGIVSEQYEIDGTMFSVTDVGGQRSERKRWAHCLKNLDAVCFVCSMSAYNRTLYEDADINRLLEAMDLFEVICNSDWFENVSKFVFLNKRDLFEEKITEVPLAEFFPDYTGGNNFDEAVDFLKDSFRNRNYADAELNIYVTTATDPADIKKVFNECKVQMLDDIARNRPARVGKVDAKPDDDTAKRIRGIAVKKTE